MEHHRVPPMMSNGGHGGQQQQQQGLRSLNPRAAVFVPRGFAPSVSMSYRPSPQSNGGGGIHLHYQNGGGIPLHYQNGGGGGSIPLHYQNDASRQVMPNNNMNGHHQQQQPNPSTQHLNPSSQQQPSNGNGAQYEMDNEIEDYLALSYLKEYIYVISNKPALLTVNGLHEITNIVNSYLEEDDCVLELVVNQLVDQSIVDVNFRYSGVKICMHFMSNIRDVPAGRFEDLLIKRIQRESSRKAAPNTANSVAHMNGLAFFIGDLFSQTKHVLVGEALPNLLMNLLSSIPKFLDENCKCVNQVLKLCGSELDELCARKESREYGKFDSIIQKLSELLNRDIHDNVKEMIKNTIKARENNWISQISPAPKWSSDVSSAAGKDGSSSSAAALVQQAERLSLGGHGNMPPGMQQSHSAQMYGDYNQFNNFNNYYDGDDFEAGGGVFYSGCDRSMRGYDFGNGDEDNQEICEDFENFLMNLPSQAQH